IVNLFLKKCYNMKKKTQKEFILVSTKIYIYIYIYIYIEVGDVCGIFISGEKVFKEKNTITKAIE
ncbi:hypothetical protein KEC49_02770, partial ['Elaeagnus angustifolia' witches'-broom phytoplasma]|nr:hypothetical protein ['Elaeagnus angustifolia' witches'-broom phytoplasma]MCG7202190.1 hypothetical protein [Candidatus Phytoplasma mali]MCX2955948.1 hypothetical protein [Candidatus Phytoplasma australiense]